jgi:hypothetical protein
MMSSIKCEWAPFVVHCLPTVVMLQGFTVLKMRQPLEMGGVQYTRSHSIEDAQ